MSRRQDGASRRNSGCEARKHGEEEGRESSKDSRLHLAPVLMHFARTRSGGAHDGTSDIRYLRRCRYTLHDLGVQTFISEVNRI